MYKYFEPGIYSITFPQFSCILSGFVALFERILQTTVILITYTREIDDMIDLIEEQMKLIDYQHIGYKENQ